MVVGTASVGPVSLLGVGVTGESTVEGVGLGLALWANAIEAEATSVAGDGFPDIREDMAWGWG